MPLSREKMRLYIQEYRERIKENAVAYLGGKCIKCGSNQDLEIDHKDPSTKSFTLARNWTRARHLTYEELNKCQLLCVRCHMEKTLAERAVPVICGTPIAYQHGCRCPQCKKSWADYNKQRRNERKSKQANP